MHVKMSRLYIVVSLGMLASAAGCRHCDGPPTDETGCRSYHYLPGAVYESNTIIEDDCLEIPNGTQIRIASGVSLFVLAHKQLKIGQGVQINAQPAARTDAPAPARESYEWQPDGKSNPGEYKDDNDGYLRCLCEGQCKGKRHYCQYTGVPPELVGRNGYTGHSAGNLRILASDLLFSAPPQVIVRGGDGGPPGPGGRYTCKFSSIACNADVPGGSSRGSAGSGGYASYISSDEALLAQLVSASEPASNATMLAVQTPGAFQVEIERLRSDGAGFRTLTGVVRP